MQLNYQAKLFLTMNSSSTTGNFGDISPFGIYSGEFDSSEYDMIIDIISKKIGCKSSTNDIKKHVKSCEHAVIMHRETKEVYTNLDKRNCKRFTFESDVVSELEKVILPNLMKTKFRIVPEDIRLDPTHGDVLLYEEGGIFQWHQDTVLECPFEDPENWSFNSMIICLDSYGGYGSTMVDCPSNKYLTYQWYQQLQEKYNLEKDNEIVRCRQTIIPKNFVVFPANLKHKSNMIEYSDDDRNFKLALKLDVWMKVPTFSSEIETKYDFSVQKNWSDVVSRVPSVYPPIPKKVVSYHNSYYYDEYDEEKYDNWNDDYIDEGGYDEYDYYNEIDECNGYCD